MFICHRGISEYYPENTIGSIVDSYYSEKYSGVEIDIQLTKDFKWIIYHDDNLLRLNDKNIKVSDIDYKDLNKIYWKGNYFKINLLSDLINCFVKYKFDSKFIINIEIKNKVTEVPQVAIDDLVNIVSKFKCKKYFSSYDHDWFDVFIYDPVEFACISNDFIPKKGNFWILEYNLYKKIDLIDLLEKDIKLGCFGKTLKDSSDEESTIPIDFQIVDDKSKKIVYVNGLFDIVNSRHIEFLEKIKKLGNYLIVGIFDDMTLISQRLPIRNLEERKKMIQSLRIVDKVITPAPVNLSRKFIQDNSIDLVVHQGNFDLLENHYKEAENLGVFQHIDRDNEDKYSRVIINELII